MHDNGFDRLRPTRGRETGASWAGRDIVEVQFQGRAGTQVAERLQ
jgi:hypothetical protein